MKEARKNVFLARETYRERRTMDAARLLPVFGVMVLFLPLFWSVEGPEAQNIAQGKIYLFSAWMLLIVLAALLSRRLAGALPREETAEEKD